MISPRSFSREHDIIILYLPELVLKVYGFAYTQNLLFYFDTRILQKVYRRTQICEINGTAYNLETEGGRKICEKGDIW
jgi:hypothetical protein